MASKQIQLKRLEPDELASFYMTAKERVIDAGFGGEIDWQADVNIVDWSEEKSTSKKENERQYGIIDQMLTMHSSLRDRMERRAFWLNTALIASSLFLTVFAFVGDDLLRALGLDPAR